jgi:hypothetical protein
MTTSKEMVLGRDFSKRKVVHHLDEDGNVIAELTPPSLGFNSITSDMNTFYARAVEVLRAGGFDPERFNGESPHGTMLRHAVLMDHDVDSQLGLAAQIVESILHFRAYKKITPPPADAMVHCAYRFGHLWRLFNVYDVRGKQAVTASRQKRPRGLNKLNVALKILLKTQKVKGRTLKEAIRNLANLGELMEEENSYEFCADGETKSFTKSNLEKLWAECDKTR